MTDRHGNHTRTLPHLSVALQKHEGGVSVYTSWHDLLSHSLPFLLSGSPPPLASSLFFADNFLFLPSLSTVLLIRYQSERRLWLCYDLYTLLDMCVLRDASRDTTRRDHIKDFNPLIIRHEIMESFWLEEQFIGLSEKTSFPIDQVGSFIAPRYLINYLISLSLRCDICSCLCAVSLWPTSTESFSLPA